MLTLADVGVVRLVECRRFTSIVVTMLDELLRGKLVDGAVSAGTSGGAHRREIVTAQLRSVGVVGALPVSLLHRRSSGTATGNECFFKPPFLLPLGNVDSRSCIQTTKRLNEFNC